MVHDIKILRSNSKWISAYFSIFWKSNNLYLAFTWGRRLLSSVIKNEQKKYEMFGEISFSINTSYLYYNSAIDFLYQYFIYKYYNELILIDEQREDKLYKFDINIGMESIFEKQIKMIEKDLKEIMK